MGENGMSMDFMLKDDIVLLGTDNIIHIPDIQILYYLRDNRDKYSKVLNLDLFDFFIEEQSLLNQLLLRPERNVLKWLSKDNSISDDDYDKLYRRIRTLVTSKEYIPYITSYIKKIVNTLFIQSYTKTIYIVFDDLSMNDIYFKRALFDLFSICESKVKIIPYQHDVIKEIIKDRCSLVMYDDWKMVDEVTDEISPDDIKHFILPSTGYNYDVRHGMLFYKGNLELKAYNKKWEVYHTTILEFKNSDDVAIG